MGERMRQDNRGVSLVELMIVIAIIALLGGVGIWGINAMTGKPAQQCAQKIMYSLERHRTTAMGKVGAVYMLVEEDGKVYLEEWVSNTDAVIDTGSTPCTSKVEIGASRVKVQYHVDSSPDLHDLPLKLSFDRSSGAFKPLDGGGYCTQIVVTRGGREFTVNLVPLTGKVYID